MKKAGIGGKGLISLAPTAWVQWVTQQPDAVAQEILSSEFQWVGRENDVLVKAYSPTVGEFLILNELQLRYSDKLPARMRAYAALAIEKYGLPTYPVLVNILPPAAPTVIAQHYESSFMGLRVRQDEKLVELEPLLAFFAGFVLGSDVVRQIMRWDMAVLRESPWYQEILREGKRQGEQRGRQEGEQALILKLLSRRVGPLSPESRLRYRRFRLSNWKRCWTLPSWSIL